MVPSASIWKAQCTLTKIYNFPSTCINYFGHGNTSSSYQLIQNIHSSLLVKYSGKVINLDFWVPGCGTRMVESIYQKIAGGCYHLSYVPKTVLNNLRHNKEK